MVGFIINKTPYYATIVVSYMKFNFKYSKKYIKYKKYYIQDFRNEYKKGDYILFNIYTNNIYKIKL